MANFDSRNYEKFIGGLEKAAERRRDKAAAVREGSRVLVFNSMWADRCPDRVQTWKTVEKVTRYSDGNLDILCTDGKNVFGGDVILVANPKDLETWMICLNDRQREFVDALNRAGDERFDVFADWERDCFVVVNRANGNEYQVTLKTIDGKVFGSCECKDFNRRNRLCKHIGKTLNHAFAGVLPKIGLAAEVA